MVYRIQSFQTELQYHFICNKIYPLLIKCWINLVTAIIIYLINVTYGLQQCIILEEGFHRVRIILIVHHIPQEFPILLIEVVIFNSIDCSLVHRLYDSCGVGWQELDINLWFRHTQVVWMCWTVVHCEDYLKWISAKLVLSSQCNTSHVYNPLYFNVLKTEIVLYMIHIIYFMF